MLQCDAYAPWRNVVNVVGSAVEWVDNPLVTRVGLRLLYGLLLSDKGCLREQPVKSIDNRSFGFAVDIAHVVVATFNFYSVAAE